MSQLPELQNHLKRLAGTPGVICGAFVNSTIGVVIANTDSDWNVHLPVVARGFARMIRAQAEVQLRYETHEQVETFQLILGDECHILCPLAHNDRVFLMVVCRLPEANIGLIRFVADEIAQIAVVQSL